MATDNEAPDRPERARSRRRRALRRGLTGAFLAAAAINQAGTATGRPRLAASGKIALVPPLLVRAVLDGAGTRRRVGLACCWLGDTLPDLVPPQYERPAQLLPFAGAHLCFLAEMWHGVAGMRGAQPLAVGLAATAAATAVATGRSAGPATGVAVGLYGTLLGGTALGLAAGGRRGAAAGAAFVASDILIAARWLSVGPPGAPHLIMGLYAGAVEGLATVR